MLDPSDFNHGIPINKLPQLTNNGIILKLLSEPISIAKMNFQGTLKINVKYQAKLLLLIDRYVEIQVTEEYGQLWIGVLFGMTVKGKGGKGPIRGCVVRSIQQETIIVESIGQAGLALWQKVIKKVNKILKNSNLASEIKQASLI